MTDQHRTYLKSNPEKDLLPLQKKLNFSWENQDTSSDNVPFSYQKPDIERPAKVFFVIISGGEVREKNYFKIISDNDKFKRIKIEFIADPERLNPKSMLEIAQILKTRYLTSHDIDSDQPDKIFLISDVDHFISELIEIKTICKNENFYLIISNSCFEVWLYYAYRSTVPTFTPPAKIEKISKEFKKWLPEVISGGVNPTKSVLLIHENIKNAKENYHEAENGIPELYSTNMFILAEELIPMIEPELSNLIKRNQKSAKPGK